MKYEISKEYAVFDIPTLLGPLNTIYRKLTNKSTTTINNPGLLVYFMVGTWSQIGQGLQMITRVLPPNSFVEVPILVYDKITGKDVDRDAAKERNQTYYKCNIYKDLFIECKSVKPEDLGRLKEEFDVFKKMIKWLKVAYMQKCPKRALGVMEINTMKHFKPDKAKNEMTNAVKILKHKDKELGKLAEEVVGFVLKEIIEFTEKNVYVD